MRKLLIISIAATFSLFIQAKDFTLDSNKSLELTGEVGYGMANAVDSYVNSVNADPLQKQAVFVINSPGGSVIAGVAILDSIDSLKVPSVCIVKGLAASMAAVILEHCTERYATHRSVIMFHRAAGGFEGYINQVNNRVGFINRLLTIMETKIANRIGQSLEEYRARANSEYWLVGAVEAKHDNIIDDEVRLLSNSVKMPQAPLFIPSDEKTVPFRKFESPVEFLKSLK